ncbi:MAG: hypothetical protein QXK39_03920, partial [Nitrososphaerota archaeon]
MLIYKSQWADMDELEKVLNTVIRYEEALMEGGRIIEFNYSEKLVYRDLEMRLDYETVRRVRREVLERAGRKAVDELERSLNYKS